MRKIQNPPATPLVTACAATLSSSANNGNGSYGCSDLARNVSSIVGREIHRPEINKPALRALAVTSGRAGESNARELATRSFGAANNQHVEEIHGTVELLDHQIAGANRHVREISGAMNPAQRYIRSQTTGTPWTKADRIKCRFLILVSLLLLAIGMNTTATVLHASGIPAFENVVSAYLFSGIPIALAAGLKALASHLEGEARRRSSTIGVWMVGFCFGILWAYLFAGTFRGLTQTTAEIIRDLTEAGGGQTSPTSSVLFVFVAIMAETFLSAGCWLTTQAICEQHQLEQLTDNPAHLKQQSDLDRWAKIHHEYIQMRSQLLGKLQAIEDHSRASVEEAVNYYRAAVKAISDNQRLDDFLGS